MGVPDGLEVFTLAERPHPESQVRSLPYTFPEFASHDAAVNRYWSRLFTDFPEFKITVCDGEGEIVAAGHCIPVFWDGTIEEWSGAGG